MIFRFQFLKALSLFIVVLILMSAGSTAAQIPNLVIKVGDVVGYANESNVTIPIYFDNRYDEIIAYNIYLELDRHDLMVFATDTQTVFDTTYYRCTTWSGPDCIDSMIVPVGTEYDTLYIDSNLIARGGIDTVGTLCGGWETVGAVAISGEGNNLNIAGIANTSGPASGIPAGQQGGTLINIITNILDVPDSAIGSVVNIEVRYEFKDRFGFVDPFANNIPWLEEEVLDTNCYRCTQWIGEVCFGEYEKIPCDYPDVDSSYTFYKTILYLDTINVKIFDGSVTLLDPTVCGDVNSSLAVDLSDLLYMVDYMFNSPPGPAPNPVCVGDVDCSGEVNLSDLLYMIDYMFQSPSGPAPCTTCCQ